MHGLAAQLSAIAGRFYGEPSCALRLVGVTGTNGKTSVSQLLAQALELLGERCGIVGTLGSGLAKRAGAGSPYHPGSHRRAGTAMELKRWAPKPWRWKSRPMVWTRGRVAALNFDVIAFTNLSRDHLDYHGSMAACYAAAKSALFSWVGNCVAECLTWMATWAVSWLPPAHLRG